MLPSHTELLDGFAWYCRAHHVTLPERERHDAQIAVLNARRLAAKLAAGDPSSEPAALLFGLSLHMRELGAAWSTFGLLVSRNFARRALDMDLVLHADAATELHRLRLTIARDREAFEGAPDDERRAMFEPLRAFVAARTRPRP